MMTTELKNDHLKLTLLPDEKRLQVILTDLGNGKAWGPVPLVSLGVYDKPLKRVEVIDKWQLMHVETFETGAHVMVSVPGRGIEVGIWLRLEEGELSVLVPPAEVYERDAIMSRVFDIDILPGLLQVQNGSLLLPLNTGMLCPTAEAPAVKDRFMIYGEQPRWELTPSLPFCSVRDKTGGMMMLAPQGACDAECRVETDGQGGGSAGFSISLRCTWVDPVDYVNRELRFIPLPHEADQVAFCAVRLRRHIMDDLGKKTLLERAAESPEVAYLNEAYIMKLFHGVENVGYMMEGKKVQQPGSFQNYMTFAEATACLRKLKAAGIDKILTQCVGWNSRGHDGMYPDRFPIEERLGGERGFRELIRAGNELGFNIQVHDNFIMQCLNAPSFDRDYVTIDIHGEPLIHGCWAGGPETSGWPLAMPESRIAGHMKRMKDLGLKGMYYVDYMEQPLEVNYHPKYGGPRSDCARGQALILQEGRRIFGACGTEFGFLPCAVEADHIATCGDAWHLTLCKDEWPIRKLIDHTRVVPVWEMAMSGLVALEARGGATWKNAMTCILYGGIPRDEWSVRPGVMPVLDDARIASLKAIYNLCVVKYGHLKLHQITHYAKPADKVHTTRFSDGTEVTADYNEERLEINGKAVTFA